MKEIEYVVSKIGLVLRVRQTRTEEEIRRHRSRIERWFNRSLRTHPTWEVVRQPEIALDDDGWRIGSPERKVLKVHALAIDCDNPEHASAVRHLLADKPLTRVYIPVIEPLPLPLTREPPVPISEFRWSRERREIRG